MLLEIPPSDASEPGVILDSSNLTARDRSVLDTLTQRVRVLSVEQVARIWYGSTASPARGAARRLRFLETAGFIQQFAMPARPELKLERPLVTWRPGRPAPDFERLSYQLVARWNQPAVSTRLIIASSAAGTWLGGHGGRRPRRSEVSHDLSLAGIYLRWLGCHPSSAESWFSEAQLLRLGFGDRMRLPDALTEQDGQRRVIELGGAYSGSKLREFHKFCEEMRLPYELW